MFLLRNKKIIDTFWLEKDPYLELCILLLDDVTKTVGQVANSIRP